MTSPKVRTPEEARRAERGSWGPDDVEITPPAKSGDAGPKARRSRLGPELQRRFDPAQPRNPHTGEWIDTHPGDGGIVKSVAMAIAGDDFSGLKQVEGAAGSNPGGVFEAPDGSRWYVKAQRSVEHAKNEALASALYREAGVNVPEVVRGKGAPGLGSGPQSASRMVDGATPDLIDRLGDEKFVRELRDGFAVDAWLANWDVAGTGLDNVVSDSDGRPWRIDLGGALLFRARGGPKGDAFGDEVHEWRTLRSSVENPAGNLLFGGMEPAELKASAKKVAAVSPERIRALVAENGMDPEVAEILIERRADIIARARSLT